MHRKYQKRSRQEYTQGRKLEIIELAENLLEKGKSKHQIAKKLDIPLPTLRRILKERDTTVAATIDGTPAGRKRLTKGLLGQAERKLVEWTSQVRSQNTPVTGSLLKSKAKKLARRLKIRGFKASPGWMGRFKARNAIKFRRIQGESGQVDMEGLTQWQRENLLTDLQRYDLNDIYNADEFPLYWKLMPDKTYALTDDPCSGTKLKKDRISALACANMTGKDKRPLWVIGKSKKPRCFKGQTIPVEYRSNKTAWMTSQIFDEWLESWDDQLAEENRYVLLYLDNLEAHKTQLELKHIEIKFLPPNTTSKSQPLDQGVIRNVKFHYKRMLLCMKVDSIDEKKEFRMNLLKALRMLKVACDLVKVSTISNCFRHAGFVPPLESEDENGPEVEEQEEAEPEDDELIQLWQELGYEGDEHALNDYLDLEETEESGDATDSSEEFNEEGKNSDAESEDPNGVKEGPKKLVDYEISSEEEKSSEEHVNPKIRRRLVFPESDEESESSKAENEEAAEEMEESFVILPSPLTARKPATYKATWKPPRRKHY